MEFTYKGYASLIGLLSENKYAFASYHNYINFEKCVILRHDIDNDIGKAIEFAELERNMGVKSIYFVLISSNFYNVYSKQSRDYIKQIIDCGHEIGLHFDEVAYPEVYGNINSIKEIIVKDVSILSELVDYDVKCVSMHRPSEEMLAANLTIPGIINSYERIFFEDFKYLSDSRRNWKEPVCDIIKSGRYDRLHILTHPFWYSKYEKDMHDTIIDFISSGTINRWDCMNSNFRNLNDVVKRDELSGL